MTLSIMPKKSPSRGARLNLRRNSSTKPKYYTGSGPPAPVRVYLLNHGESNSADEANVLDPMLSPLGFSQATQGWEVLLKGELQNYQDTGQDGSASSLKVHIFTSPMKRSMGTAMMVAFAELPKNDSRGQSYEAPSQDPQTSPRLSFPLPLSHHQDAVNEDSHMANIVVLNGLCDAAEDVTRRGGAARVVSQGLLDCAAASIISSSSVRMNERNDITEQLDEMKEISGQSLVASSRPFTEDDVLPATRVQFWRDHQGDSFTPMHKRPFLVGKDALAHHIMDKTDACSTTPPLTPEPSPPLPPPLEKTSDHEGRRKMVSVSTEIRHPERDNFMGAINHAAHLTAKSPGAVCVIVTDSDGIRSLITSCGYNNRRLQYNPGCIAKFVATVAFPSTAFLSNHGAYSIKWAFHGLEASNDTYTPISSSVTSVPPSSLARVQVSLSLDLPSTSDPASPPLHDLLALLVPPRDVSLLGKVFIPNDLSITYYSKKRALEDKRKEIDNTHNATLFPLDILHGRHKIANFVQHLKQEKKVACGSFESHAGDGRVRTFVIDPAKQPPLPSPPCSLYFLVHS